MKIARSVLGIVFGFGVFFAIVQMLSAFAGTLTNAAPGNYLLLSVTWTIAAAVLGGYATARIAGTHEFPHAAAVGMLMIGMSFLSHAAGRSVATGLVSDYDRGLRAHIGDDRRGDPAARKVPSASLPISFVGRSFQAAAGLLPGVSCVNPMRQIRILPARQAGGNLRSASRWNRSANRR